MVTVPERLVSVPAAVVLKARFDSSTPRAVPELSIELLLNVKLVTCVPLTPLPAVFWIDIQLNEGLSVLVSEMPWLVVFRMVPPLLALPVPVTVRLPEEPVLLSTMPLVGPLAAVPAEMLRNFRPLLPI